MTALTRRHRPDPIRSELHHNDSSKNDENMQTFFTRPDKGLIEEYGQASRTISTASLNASRRLHSQPIKQVVFLRPLGALRPREALS